MANKSSTELEAMAQRRWLELQTASYQQELDSLSAQRDELAKLATARRMERIHHGGDPRSRWQTWVLLSGLATLLMGNCVLPTFVVAPRRCKTICAARGLPFHGLAYVKGRSRAGLEITSRDGCLCGGKRIRDPNSYSPWMILFQIASSVIVFGLTCLVVRLR